MSAQAPRYYSDKTVLIVGAGCALGRVLALQLADVGTTVIVLDHDTTHLMQTASYDPTRIETLTIAPQATATIAKLGEIWEDEPIDLLVMLQPLSLPRRPGLAAKSSLLFLDALKLGLARAKGAVVSVIPAAGGDDDPVAQSAYAAMAQLARAMPRQLRETGVRANAISASADLCDSDPEQVADPVLFLGSEGARAINGALLPVGAQKSARN